MFNFNLIEKIKLVFNFSKKTKDERGDSVIDEGKKVHDIFQQKVKDIFADVGITCVEEDINSGPGKKTDLKCENEKMLIEIKTFQGSKKLQKKENDHCKKMNNKFRKSKSYMYWIEDKPNILKHHLESSAKKFKEKKYKEYKTIVALQNELAFNYQTVYDLLLHKNLNISSSIGVVIQFYKNVIVVFFNKNAKNNRIIDKSFFEKFKNKFAVSQFIYDKNSKEKISKIS